MVSKNNIQYLLQHQVDKQKWDACIREADNELIYAYSYYLDATSPGWEALVMGDYSFVMPLTQKQKWGICYLYQPLFTAQLGVFGKNINPNLVQDFIGAIPEKYKLIEISLNSLNNEVLQNHYAKSRRNYVLNLTHPYEKLLSSYRINNKRNIRKSIQANCKLITDLSFDKLMTMIYELPKNSFSGSKTEKQSLGSLFSMLKNKNKAIAYGAELNGALVSVSVFFISGNRAYYIYAANQPAGKKIGASHMLVDAFIKQNAGTNLSLDFEGSDVESLAFFYGGFGAQEINYPFIKINRLPLFLRWLKK